MSRAAQRTRGRLLKAAAALFADRGFHGTKLRDIAARGKVNVAAGHYHYGSKKQLYVEVLRGQFAEVRSVLQRSGVSRTAQELRGLQRAELVELLHKRLRAMLDSLLGPPPSLHGTLMHREMCDPSEALPVIADEFIRPLMDELQSVLAALAPQLAASEIERCAFSMVGQVLFYRTAMPAMLHLKGWRQYPRDFKAQITDHITAFSVGGLEKLIQAQGRAKHAR